MDHAVLARRHRGRVRRAHAGRGRVPPRPPVWRNTTIIRDNVVEEIKKLKAAPGKTIITDGSHELVHTLLAADLVDELHLLLYPLILGSGKRLFPDGVRTTFALKSARPYPSGVVGLHYTRAR